jgi:hypothetical protein
MALSMAICNDLKKYISFWVFFFLGAKKGIINMTIKINKNLYRAMINCIYFSYFWETKSFCQMMVSATGMNKFISIYMLVVVCTSNTGVLMDITFISIFIYYLCLSKKAIKHFYVYGILVYFGCL